MQVINPVCPRPPRADLVCASGHHRGLPEQQSCKN